MKPGMTISCAGHALALGFAVVAISASPMNAPPVEAITTQIVSVKDFSQMTKGVKNAPQLKIPDMKPLADKVGEEKSVDQIAPKVAEKPPITTDAKSDPPPKPDTPKPDPKTAKADPKPPDPKPEQKPDPKPADKPKPLEYKPDQIASLLKKDAAKDQQKQPKFDANQVAQLLDQRTPQRQLASAAALNNNAGYGSATAEQSAQLSQSAQAAFVRKVQSCMIWPPGTDTSTNITVNIEVLLNRDGTLAGAPQTIAPAPISALGPALAESAKRALIKCQPYTMFKDEPYDQWRDLAPAFNPSILMNGG
jgi:outer membrane biosynthesis protein TonB